ncbi:MAG: Crp/Fnr family transcriptional regulator [Hyphomicrobiaceae bacterium]
MEPQALVALLGKSEVFGALAALDRGAIASRMHRIHFEPGQMIFSRGDPARELYLVLEGKVRLSVLTTDGRELSFAHAGPGKIFGEIATLDGGERTASATAINRVQVMALPQRAILDLIENNPKLAVAAIRFLCTRLRETDLLLEAIALHRIEVRLSRLLLSALKSQARTAASEEVPLDLGMSQGELALLIGASRPKVTNALSALEDMGAIARKGELGKLMCNTGMLQEIAETE